MKGLDCECLIEDLPAARYDATVIGIDETYGRFGEVEIWRCKTCSTPWLYYFVTYEGFTASGRYFMGHVSEGIAATVTAGSAANVLASLPRYFQGGSHFGGRHILASGPPRVDL